MFTLCKFIQFNWDGFPIFGFSKGIFAPKHSCKKKNCTHFSFSRGCVQFSCGGELGIRTPGSFHYDGFQDRCFRPLSQLSIFSLMFTCQHNEICGARDKFCALRHCYALGIRAIRCFILCVRTATYAKPARGVRR